FAEEKERESGNQERVTEEEDKAVATVVVPAVAPPSSPNHLNTTTKDKDGGDRCDNIRNNGNNEVWVRRLT
ncbi:hypothetical protein M8C21_017517, partial [Ambrosia artemisiifolia]